MKNTCALLVFVVGALSFAYASHQQSQPKSNVEGTVVGVEKVDTAAAFVGSNPSDAPLAAPETYDYDVAIQVNCGTYVARYVNWYDYVPSALDLNQKVEVRLTPGVIYVDVPYQRQLRMQIVRRKVQRQQACATN